jgi:uncharacterized protein YjdB
MLNKIVDSMKAYGGIASVAQILNTSNGQDITWATSDGTSEEGELLGKTPKHRKKMQALDLQIWVQKTVLQNHPCIQ